jgi:hypothetical protein
MGSFGKWQSPSLGPKFAITAGTDCFPGNTVARNFPILRNNSRLMMALNSTPYEQGAALPGKFGFFLAITRAQVFHCLVRPPVFHIDLTAVSVNYKISLIHFGTARQVSTGPD